MVHDLGPGHRLGHGRRVAHVALEQLDLAQDLGQVPDPSGGQVVQHPDGLAVLQQRPDQAGADEPGPAGDEHAHRRSSGWATSAGAVASRHNRPPAAVPITKATASMVKAAASETWSEA